MKACSASSRSRRMRPRPVIPDSRAAVIRAAMFFMLLALAGCTAFEHPLVGETDSLFDRRLVGHWAGAIDEDSFQLVIRRDGRADITTTSVGETPEKKSARIRTARVGEF